MSTQSVNIISEAYQLVLEPNREWRLSSANRLAGMIATNLSSFAPDVVTGESGVPSWIEATRHLVERKELHPLEAWMVAEVVAAGAVAAHEIANLELVSEELVEDLTRHLADGALNLTDIIYQVN